MLYDVAFRCLLAVRRANDAPVKVTAKELNRWQRLAAQSLTEVGEFKLAAQLHAMTHSYTQAREILEQLKDWPELARVCEHASEYYGSAAKTHKVNQASLF